MGRAVDRLSPEQGVRLTAPARRPAPAASHARGVARDDRAGSDVARDDGPGPDDGVRADGDAGEDGGVGADAGVNADLGIELARPTQRGESPPGPGNRWCEGLGITIKE